MDFTSIPSTFTDLVIKISGRSASTAILNYTLKFNGLATNFSARNLFGAGSGTPSSGTQTTNDAFALAQPNGYTANTFDNLEIYISNYAGSTNKSFSLDGVTENNATTAYSIIQAGLWSNSSAITSISIFTTGFNMLQHSTAYLYGVSNA
jgi:hypothetical protein